MKLEPSMDSNGHLRHYFIKREFATLFHQDVEIFTGTTFLNVDQQEKQLDKEEFQEIKSMAAFRVLETQALYKREYDSQMIERQMQTTEEKVDTGKALDASMVITESSKTEFEKQNTNSSSGNDADSDNADIKPVYDEEPMVETVAQFQKDFSKLEAHCIALELKYQNQALKEGQHGQFLKVKSNEAKVKQDIDVIDTINIELEHKVAKLLRENETLKKHYKELFDSIKTTRAKTIEHTTSLIAQNAEFKAQLQEKGFAFAALKNELRKLKGNSMNTKFAKPLILGKPILHPLRNQSVVR
ncbi:hypothetical protein Tco_0296558 [Tanacetum coccineum]